MDTIFLEFLEELLKDFPDVEYLIVRLRLEKIAKGELSIEFLIQEIIKFIKDKPDGVKLEFLNRIIARFLIDQCINKILRLICAIINEIKSSEDKRRGIRSLLWALDKSDLSERTKMKILNEIFSLLNNMADFDLSEVLVTFSYVSIKLKDPNKVKLLEKILDKINQIKEDSQIAKALFSFIDFLDNFGARTFIIVNKKRIEKIIMKISNPAMRNKLHQKLQEILQEREEY